MGTMVLVYSGSHMQHILSEYYAQLGHAHSVIFANPVLNWESLKNISLKERQIINLPGASICLEPTGPTCDTWSDPSIKSNWTRLV
jgi:hypothetical protein